MPEIYARAILPRKKPFPANKRRVEGVIRGAAQEIAALAIAYHEEIASRWSEENQPEFGAIIKIDLKKAIRILVYARGEKGRIWRLVSKGTPERTIVPKKKGGVLVFRKGYKPRTTPGGGYKGPGKATGDVVFTKKVKKHKIRPRRFERTVARWLRQRKDVRLIMNNAMARAKRVL